MDTAVRVQHPPLASETPHRTDQTPLRLIDLSDCLAIANVSESTFYRLIKREQLPAPVKFGRANRWVESDVYAAIGRLVAGDFT